MKKVANAVLSFRFLALIVAGILILFSLQANFSWAKISLGRLFSYPEVRFYRYPPLVASLGPESFAEDIFAVENRGTGTAGEVYISVALTAGQIARYDFLCQERYVLVEERNQDGRLGIWLERLSPGARALLYVWSESGGERPLPADFSVTAQNGTVEPMTAPSAREELTTYVSFVEWVARVVFNLLQRIRLVEPRTLTPSDLCMVGRVSECLTATYHPGGGLRSELR